MRRFENLIDGQWVPGNSFRPNINPSDTSDVIGEYAQADETQTQSAIAAARSAFPLWANAGIQLRHDVLDQVCNEILARKEEIGYMLSREEGKTLAEGVGETVSPGPDIQILRRGGFACRW